MSAVLCENSGMRRSYKFLLRPTARQVAAMSGLLRLHCEIYNAALQERRDAWRTHRVSVSYTDQARQVKELREVRADVAAVPSHPIYTTLRLLDKSFQDFFRRVKAGQTPGYPRFKSQTRFDSVIFGRPSEFKLDPASQRVRLSGIGHVRVHAHRVIPAEAVMKTATVKRDGRRWYVIISCDDVPTALLPRTGAVTGIDLGVASLVTTSEGEHVANPRHGQKKRDKLAAAQRALAHCKPGSNRRKRARARVSTCYRQVRNQRRDTAHKLALDLVRRHDVVVHEKLAIPNMVRSARGTVEHPGSMVAQKSATNRSILDAGWGEFLEILRGKAEWAGREVIAVNPRNTSRRCSQCGHVAAENRVSQATFQCQACGHEAHADVNAAINILRAGLALREVGA